MSNRLRPGATSNLTRVVTVVPGTGRKARHDSASTRLGLPVAAAARYWLPHVCTDLLPLRASSCGAFTTAPLRRRSGGRCRSTPRRVYAASQGDACGHVLLDVLERLRGDRGESRRLGILRPTSYGLSVYPV